MEEVIHTFGLDWKLLVFQTVNFLLLLYILKRFLYKPVLSFIEERQKNIAKGVEDAALAASKLSEAEDTAARTRTEALREAEKLSAEARRHAEERKEAILREASLRSAELVEEGKRGAEEEKRRALRESEEEITKLSLLAAEKILKEKTPHSHAR
ncbi:MAG TPA: F0F1 ATP synthase subunit B [Candidatus Paceibacterota bacterium]|nr:F0F1 ATP synthase subunit B [Candidatus Paceibacterota bacterium]